VFAGTIGWQTRALEVDISCGQCLHMALVRIKHQSPFLLFTSVTFFLSY